MQKLKVHTEAAMLKMDKVLASNQLTMAGTAALPGVVLVGGLIYLIRRLLSPRTHSLIEANLRLRLILTEVERSILEVYSSHQSTSSNTILIPSFPTHTSTMKQPNNSLYARGMLQYHLYQLRYELSKFFSLPISNHPSADVRMSRWSIMNVAHMMFDSWIYNTDYNPIISEYNSILKDINELESSDEIIPGQRKVITVMRMRTNYRCFLPKS